MVYSTHSTMVIPRQFFSFVKFGNEKIFIHFRSIQMLLIFAYVPSIQWFY